MNTLEVTWKFINRTISRSSEERVANRAEIKSKRASLELEEARGRRGETGKQWKWNTLEVHHVVLTFHPPLQPSTYQVLALILEQRGSAPDCRSYVKRGFAIRRKTEIRRVVKVSLNRCISLLFRHFCFVPLPHLWKLRTEERWKKGTWKNFARRNRGSSSSKNARIGSSFLVLSHARIIGDNSWNFYRKSRMIQSPVWSRRRKRSWNI